MSDAGISLIENDRCASQDAADRNADSADMIERQRKEPFVLGAKVECSDCPFGVGEEVREGEGGDFRGAGRAGSEKKKG